MRIEMILDFENAPFLTARLQFLVQDIKVSLEYVDFYTKDSLNFSQGNVNL